MTQDELNEQIWNTIHEEAKKQKKTAKDICTECNISEDTYKHKSAKKGSLSFGDLMKICAVLGIGFIIAKLIKAALTADDSSSEEKQ